ncbi:MAG TPA: hypothetical protein VFE47_23585 [Tepidisphaeraceae bacterium]|jgi:hypothetical protein|nr:hypothetical protein [Tepidisphaeraceae bacterium]
MALTPEFAPDAESQWLALDVELQELTLDEIEVLLHRPLASTTLLYHDFVHDADGVRHYVFLEALVSSANQKLTIIGVNYLTRKIGS